MGSSATSNALTDRMAKIARKSVVVRMKAAVITFPELVRVPPDGKELCVTSLVLQERTVFLATLHATVKTEDRVTLNLESATARGVGRAMFAPIHVPKGHTEWVARTVAIATTEHSATT